MRDRVFQIDGLSTHECHLESLAQLVPFARTKDLHVLMDHLPSLLRTPSSHRRYDGQGHGVVFPFLVSLFSVVCIKQFRKSVSSCCARRRDSSLAGAAIVAGEVHLCMRLLERLPPAVVLSLT